MCDYSCSTGLAHREHRFTLQLLPWCPLASLLLGPRTDALQACKYFHHGCFCRAAQHFNLNPAMMSCFRQDLWWVDEKSRQRNRQFELTNSLSTERPCTLFEITWTSSEFLSLIYVNKYIFLNIYIIWLYFYVLAMKLSGKNTFS